MVSVIVIAVYEDLAVGIVLIDIADMEMLTDFEILTVNDISVIVHKVHIVKLGVRFDYRQIVVGFLTGVGDIARPIGSESEPHLI